jgi:hypothetical protein
MKIIAASIGMGVGLLAAALPAYAGPCSTEIETLTQALTSASTDSSPGAPGTPAVPKAPASAGTPPADPLEPIQPPKVTDSHTVPKAPSTSGSPPANPLEPTAAASGSTVADAGAMPEGGSQGGSVASDDAAAALQRARDLDQAGDEAGCMAEIVKAKELIVTQ